jgi:hypothetical protein
LGRAGNALADDSPANSQPDTQCAAYGLRFHSVYDGISDPWETLFAVCLRFPVALKRRQT